jgi:hypothetical protein
MGGVSFDHSKRLTLTLSPVVGGHPVVGTAPFKCEIEPRFDDVADKIRKFAVDMDSSLLVEDASIYEVQIRAVLAKQDGRP